MVQIFLEIGGKHYRLKYQKVKTINEELYQGIVFLKDPIGFSYIIRKDKSVFFENKFIDRDLQKLIVNVIEKKERDEV